MQRLNSVLNKHRHGEDMATKRQQARYVDECMQQILRQPGVHNCVVLDVDGMPVRSSMADDMTVQCVGLFGQLIDKARKVVIAFDDNDDIVFLRIRSRKHEVLITPDGRLIFLVIQLPVDEVERAFIFE